MSESQLELFKSQLEDSTGIKKHLRELDKKINMTKGITYTSEASKEMAKNAKDSNEIALQYLKKLIDGGVPYEEAKRKAIVYAKKFINKK